MTPTLHEQLHAARYLHPLLLKGEADSAGNPRDKHQATIEVHSNERKMAMLGEQIEECEALILLSRMSLAKLGPAPSPERLANAKQRIEEGFHWLQAELGTPVQP